MHWRIFKKYICMCCVGHDRYLFVDSSDQGPRAFVYWFVTNAGIQNRGQHRPFSLVCRNSSPNIDTSTRNKKLINSTLPRWKRNREILATARWTSRRLPPTFRDGVLDPITLLLFRLRVFISQTSPLLGCRRGNESSRWRSDRDPRRGVAGARTRACLTQIRQQRTSRAHASSMFTPLFGPSPPPRTTGSGLFHPKSDTSTSLLSAYTSQEHFQHRLFWYRYNDRVLNFDSRIKTKEK